MRFPLTEAEIDLATDAMLQQLGHTQTDDDARKDIRLWISMANEMYKKGFHAGMQSRHQTEPDEM